MLIRLPRTLVPSQSTTAATNGIGMPGAASATIVNARTSPSRATSTSRNSVPKHDAHALRRSKSRAPHDGALVRTRCGDVAEHQVVDQRNLFTHPLLPPPAAAGRTSIVREHL